MLQSMFRGLGSVSAILTVIVIFGASKPARGVPVLNEKEATPLPALPDFESHGLVSSDKGIGSGWWNYRQFGSDADIYVGANTTQKVIGVYVTTTIDKDDTSWFSIHASMRMLDGAAPTGTLNYSQSSSSDSTSSWLSVKDELVQVWTGEFNDSDEPIYVHEMWARLTFSLYAPANFHHLSGSFGSWTEEWQDNNDAVYFFRSGNEFSFQGSGVFLGENAQEIGKGLVEKGMASYGVVPEPTTFAAAIAACSSVILSRQRRVLRTRR